MEVTEDGDGPERCSVDRGDVSLLIALCAHVEGHLLGDPERHADLVRTLGRRFVEAGATPPGPDARAVRQVVNDVNHRLRYALGEYPDPPDPVPVPD